MENTERKIILEAIKRNEQNWPKKVKSDLERYEFIWDVLEKENRLEENKDHINEMYKDFHSSIFHSYHKGLRYRLQKMRERTWNFVYGVGVN